MPADCDLLVTGGRVLDLATASDEVRSIAIDNGRIVAVGDPTTIAAAWTAATTVDASDSVVSPGFIDGHVHLSAMLAASMPYQPSTGPSLFSGGSNVSAIVPFVAEMTSMELPAELTATVVRPLLGAMLRSGITGVVDAGSSGLEGLVQAAADAGIRAAIGPSLCDSWHDDGGELARRADADELLAGASRFIADHDGSGDGRVRALVSAVETIACTDALLAGIAELVEAADVPSHVHCHISEPSDLAHGEAYGLSATARLEAAGLLTPRFTAMHVGNASEADIATLAGSGATVNHNALGNAMLGFSTVGRRAVPAMLAAGIPIVLGSDYTPSMVATPFDMMRAALAVHREEFGADDALTLEQVLAMATNSGVALGRPGEVGRLAVGQLADLVVVDVTGAHHLGDRHPVPSLALRARSGDVRTVVVDGRIVVEDGRLVSFDEEKAVDDARALLARLG